MSIDAAPPDSVLGVVANVVLERPFGPGGVETRSGTKQFAPGTKVCVFQRIGWSTYQRVRVLGRHRKSERLIELTLGAELLANWRAERVYSPQLVRKLLDDETMTSVRAADMLARLNSGEWAYLPLEMQEFLLRRCTEADDERLRWLAKAGGEEGRAAAEWFVQWLSKYGAGQQPYATRSTAPSQPKNESNA